LQETEIIFIAGNFQLKSIFAEIRKDSCTCP